MRYLVPYARCLTVPSCSFEKCGFTPRSFAQTNLLLALLELFLGLWLVDCGLVADGSSRNLHPAEILSPQQSLAVIRRTHLHWSSAAAYWRIGCIT